MPPAVFLTDRILPPCIHGYDCLQIVQRSLLGGYLTEDAKLLKANARTASSTKLQYSHHRHRASGVRAAPDESPTHGAEGGSAQPL